MQKGLRNDIEKKKTHRWYQGGRSPLAKNNRNLFQWRILF